MLVETPGTDEYTGRFVSFEEDAHESGKAMEEYYDLEEKGDIPEDAILEAGRSSGARPLARNLMEELDEVVRPEPAFGDDDDEERDGDDDDSKQAVTTSQVTEQKTGYRPPMNGDTPAANKVLGRTYEEMMEKMTATTTGQVANDTMQFLKSMGLQAQTVPTQAILESWIPAEVGADLWKWKRKLRVGFGVTDIHYPQPPIGKTAGGGVDPSKIPLPQPDHDGGRANATRSTVRGSRRRWDRNRYDEDDSSSGEEDDLYKRPQQDGVLNEYIRQIEKASSPEGERSTQKIELATHRPLGQIRAFLGLRNKSGNSMLWLRGFVYEMKGTRASPDEWCMPFQLKTRYYSAKREDKEHLCDYLNRLNGYARNAGIQCDKGGRKARDPVKRFLETCGDRGLERRLCHVKVYDIHELEEMIIEILKVDDRESAKDLLNPDPEVTIQVDRSVMTIQEMTIHVVIVVIETSDAVAMTRETSRETPLQKDST
ncbi:hypothetical protein PHMEG_00029776 [Phytophthora megakarya]|uniref:Eukaryotic/viral aspartic protease n=1 Tax=Phytophthora megakarya TaxID=4795 RepID=A0A225V1T5_9STRA|nr:hypothetical protein PHMEG_00029776 [Phytophthora megakarya]